MNVPGVGAFDHLVVWPYGGALEHHFCGGGGGLGIRPNKNLKYQMSGRGGGGGGRWDEGGELHFQTGW